MEHLYELAEYIEALQRRLTITYRPSQEVHKNRVIIDFVLIDGKFSEFTTTQASADDVDDDEELIALKNAILDVGEYPCPELQMPVPSVSTITETPTTLNLV